jgi:hypothetical protein
LAVTRHELCRHSVGFGVGNYGVGLCLPFWGFEVDNDFFKYAEWGIKLCFPIFQCIEKTMRSSNQIIEDEYFLQKNHL